MGMMVGGPGAWKVRKHGEIGVAFHWVNEEPAMVLFPANRSAGSAFILALSSAYKYADSQTGQPTPYLIEQCSAIATHMGFDAGLSFAIRKIADVIVDSLPDLIVMPPEPQSFIDERKKAEVGAGELAFKVGGETVMETEI